MKKLIYIATLAGVTLFGNTSCVDLLQEPQSFITEEDYMTTMDLDALKQAVSGLYTNLWNDNYGFNCRTQRMNICADEMTYRAAKANNELANYGNLSPNITANTADYDTTWKLFYTVINNANKLINKSIMPTNEEDAIKFKEVLGEAYFMRGLAYFYLVRYYGDIPLVLNEEDIIVNMPKTSVADIYDKVIIPSLEIARDWLPKNENLKDEDKKNKRIGNSIPTHWSAKVCLADVYMTMAGWPLKREPNKYYQMAANELENIIDNANKVGLKLTENYKDLWLEANKNQTNEFMFTLHHSAALKTASNYGKSYYPFDYYPNAGWADYYANLDFYNNYPNDKRKEHNFMTKWKVKSGEKDSEGNDIPKEITFEESSDKLPAISKYYNYDEGAAGKSAQSNGVTCIYRYADVLLMYAEAATRATGSVNTKAQNALWDVQKRAQGYPSNPTLTTTTNKDEFLEAVFNENGWEFFAEMRRWFDLVRLEKVSEKRADAWENSLFKANNHYYFPIPYQQINLTGWTNNPGY